MYIPKPIDTSHIKLPEDLLALTEKIAENVHEVWSQNRIAEGWTWGEHRDDARKQTPCLVPYAELPQEEREYDRKTALNTLRLVIALGYTIQNKKKRTVRKSNVLS